MVFYEPGVTDHGLPHDPFKACVVPRPVRPRSRFLVLAGLRRVYAS